MRKIIVTGTVVVFLGILASCSSESDIAGKGTLTEEQQAELSFIPAKHNIYKGLLAEYDLNKFDELYRTEFAHPDSLHLEYNQNVRIVAFVLLMEKGLAEKGTPEQKQYYLEQQLKMEGNLPDTKHFYALLESCMTSMSTKTVSEIENRFYEESLEKLKAIPVKDYDAGKDIADLKQRRKNLKLVEIN